MLTWYVTIFLSLFNFGYIAARPNEYGAAMLYILFQIMLLAADKYFGKNIYKLFRMTSSLILWGCVVLLLSEQEDYQARKNIIMTYSRTVQERETAIEKLKEEYNLDDDWAWPLDNTTNRQLWIVVALDVLLWAGYTTWKYINNERAFPRMNNLRMMSTSSEDTSSSEEHV